MDGEAAAFEAVLTSLHGVRDYLASSPPAERFTHVVDALQAILAEANEAREVRVFEPDENLDDDAGDDDGDDEDGLDADDGADDGDLDDEFEE